MPIPDKISIPNYPRFLPSPDSKTMELYIVCTSPLALIWVRQTIPAQLYIVEGPKDEHMLRECGEWYKNFASTQMDKN